LKKGGGGGVRGGRNRCFENGQPTTGEAGPKAEIALAPRGYKLDGPVGAGKITSKRWVSNQLTGRDPYPRPKKQRLPWREFESLAAQAAKWETQECEPRALGTPDTREIDIAVVRVAFGDGNTDRPNALSSSNI